MKSKNLTVILTNLGGPNNLAAVRPFLFNLFYDPYIIRLKNPFRWLLAKLISSLRHKKAQAIYRKIGGKSPLLENTEKQAQALEVQLNKHIPTKVHIAMRYWHPFANEVIEEILSEDEIIVVPLYPQFSTTTTLSSLKEISKLLGKNPKFVCCYPTQKNFIAAHVDLLQKTLEPFKNKHNTRILFVAHGLPQDIVDSGDPYPDHVALTVGEILKQFPHDNTVICYQSRVGPKKWLTPSIESEIMRAGRHGCDVVVCPISFVSDHSETLVELDMDMREIATEAGVQMYARVPSLQNHPKYIETLCDLVLDEVNLKQKQCFCPKGKLCCQVLMAQNNKVASKW